VLAVLGVVANVMQLVDYSCKILDRIEGFNKGVKELPKSFRNLQVELPLLANILRRTNQKADSGQLDEETCKAIQPIIEACQTDLTALQEIFSKSVPKEGASKPEVVWKAITSLKLDKQVERAASSIASFVRTLTLHYAESAGFSKEERAVIIDAVSKLSVSKEKPPDFRIPFVLTGVPITANFIGRDKDLRQLESFLEPEKGKIRRQLCVVHGLGGLGKTQLAIEYARQNKLRYSSMLWLDGSTEESLVQSILQNAKRIPGQVENGVKQGTTFEESKVQALKLLQWFALDANNEWLLAYDNVDKAYFSALKKDVDSLGSYDITEFFPEGDFGSILITTRLQRLSALGKSIHLRKLNRAESLDLLENISNKQLNRIEATSDESNNTVISLSQDVSDLLKRLDGLPLALVLAGTYLQLTDIKSYMELYDRSWKELHASMDELYDYPQKTIVTTWMICFKHLEAVDKSVANLFKMWGFMDNRDLWYELICWKSNRPGQPDWLKSVSESKITFLRAVKLLLNHSMIRKNEDSNSYSIHAVVSDWLQAISSENDEGLFQTALSCIAHAIPSSEEAEYWTLQQRILPHADKLTKNIKTGKGAILETEISLDIGTPAALRSLGLLYSDQGRFDSAQYMYELAINVLKNQGNDQALSFDVRDKLGILYYYQGQDDKAEKMLMQVMQEKEEVLGVDDASTLTTANNFSIYYVEQGKYAEAEKLLTRVLAGNEREHGPDHPRSLMAVNNLGHVYILQGKLDKAESFCLRSLKGKEKFYGPEHPTILGTVNNLGTIYRCQKRTEEAEMMYSRALEGYQNTLGAEHPETLETLGNMGDIFKNQGRLVEAESMYMQSLQGFQNILKTGHPSIVAVFQKLGELYSLQQRNSEAEQMYLQALKGRETALGPDHAITLAIVYNLGNVYKEQGDMEKSRSFTERALQHENFEMFCDICGMDVRGVVYYCDTCKLGECNVCGNCVSDTKCCPNHGYALLERILKNTKQS